MSSFGYSVLGFGTVATAAAGVAAPSSAVIKAVSNSASDNVDVQLSERGSFGNAFVSPADVGGSSGDPIEWELADNDGDGNYDDNIRFSMIKTVGGGTVATHAWSAVIAHTAGSGGTFVGGSATATSSTSGTFTTPAFDGSTFTGGLSPDTGTITFSYTATNAGGSNAATDVVVHWISVG